MSPLPARSSEPTSISAGSSPPLSNSSPSGRTGPATPWQTLQAGPAGTSCWESRWATAAKVMAEPAKAPTPAALDGAPTPERGGPGLSSGSAWSQSCQLSTAWNARRNSSLLCRTRAAPTPTSQFKVPKFATGKEWVIFLVLKILNRFYIRFSKSVCFGDAGVLAFSFLKAL